MNSVLFTEDMASVMGGAQVEIGPDLEEVQTDSLGFLALAAERKLRLLPTPWPVEALPPPTASLLTVASGKGLLAAAGLDALVVASTESVRGAFKNNGASGNIIPYEPPLKIPMPMRISQVAFSVDESSLIISTEQGGGLVVYSVDALMQGITNPAFELSTNGAPLRALLPNPAPESAHLVAVVSAGGDLFVANLKDQLFVSGPSGQVLKQGVSCVSWSTRGKQLVAGLGDGTAYQLTPQGEGKAVIPKPPAITDNQHISSITWLENHLFLVIHTPTNFDPGSVPASTFHLVTRQPPSAYGFQKLSDPCFPAGLNRSPPYQFVSRLKDFPPSLRDVLIVASTGSTDIGLLTRSKAPLTEDVPAVRIVDVFTTTTVGNDSRRAQLSMTEDMSDTSPIGLALDLSSKENVPRPFVGPGPAQSSTPLPAMLVLNNEGVLAAWWFVYTDSISQGAPYPGLVAMGGQKAQPLSSQPAQASPVASLSQPGAFTGPPPASVAALVPGGANNAPPAVSSFGGSTSGAFGSPTPPAFGSTSNLGVKASPWSSPSSVALSQGKSNDWGQPTFGSPTPLGGVTQRPAFGMASIPGNRQSPWATASSATPQHGLGSNPPSSFGAIGNPQSSGQATLPSNGGFGSYANQGGFAAAGAPNPTGQSIFATTDHSAPISSIGSSFGAPVADQSPKNGFSGLGASGFKLTPTFKGDGTAKYDAPRMSDDSMGSFFKSGFNLDLNKVPESPPNVVSRESEVEHGTGNNNAEQIIKQQPENSGPSTTPDASPKGHVLGASKPGVGGTFSTQAQSASTPAMVEQSKPATLPHEGLRNQGESGVTPELPKTPLASPPAISSHSKLQAIKSRGEVDTQEQLLPEPPLPPDSTSKTPYVVGDSSSSSDQTATEDAPLPPDFLPRKKGSSQADADELTLPGAGTDDDDGNWEDSGEDVTQDLNSPNDVGKSVGLTPQGSFDDSHDRSRESLGGPFTQISHPARAPRSKPLFGEIGHSVPFVPLLPRTQQSPRSPSPVRPSLPGKLLRPEGPRSISLPGGTPKPAATSSFPSRLDPLRQLKQQPQPQLQLQPEQDEEEENWSDEEQPPRAALQAELEGTTTLPVFIAHQDYVGRVKSAGIGGQIERLYYDINSMVDTLGLNAKALKSFTKGHNEQSKPTGRKRDDLETEDDWCLVEISELGELEDEMMDRLKGVQLKDVRQKLKTFQEIQEDVGKRGVILRRVCLIGRTRLTSLVSLVRSKFGDLRKVLDARMDPAQIAAVRAAPLSSEQTVQRQDIHAESQHIQTLLSQAEEAITVLRAKLASSGGGKGSGADGAQAAPTVEAVVRTIMKLTSMVERKSGDVDLLERQIRRLYMEGNNNNNNRTKDDTDDDNNDGNQLRDSMNSLYLTPRSSNHPVAGSDGSLQPSLAATKKNKNIFGQSYSPDHSPSSSRHGHRSGDYASNASPLALNMALSLTTTLTPTPSTSISTITTTVSPHSNRIRQSVITEPLSEHLQRERTNRARKRLVAEKLARILASKGPRVRPFPSVAVQGDNRSGGGGSTSGGATGISGGAGGS